MNKLPSSISALWFACQCLGIGSPGTASIHREDIRRACQDHRISDEKKALIRDQLEKEMFSRLRREDVAFLGIATSIADVSAITLVRAYEELQPRINQGAASIQDALWIFCRHVAVPSLRRIIDSYSKYGLGTEFRGDSCWYIPQNMDGKPTQPVAVVLDRWLRLAGFRTAYGVSKPNVSSRSAEEDSKWESHRKQIRRWLSDDTFPPLKELHQLVDKFGDSISWIDTADSWKARFALAHFSGRACREIDAQFSNKGKFPSFQLAEEYRALGKELHWHDDAGLLTSPATYFAVRLWLRHLESTGEWEALHKKVPKEISRTFSTAISDEEIRRTKLEDRRAMNFGNHLADHLLKIAGLSDAASGTIDRFTRDAKLKEYLFDFAGNELSRLIEEEHKTARERVVPRRKPKPKRRAQSSS